jgi:hypothetical protein
VECAGAESWGRAVSLVAGAEKERPSLAEGDWAESHERVSLRLHCW